MVRKKITTLAATGRPLLEVPSRAELKARYETLGQYLREIAEHYKVSVPTVRRWLGVAGIETRGRGVRREEHQYNGPQKASPEEVAQIRQLAKRKPKITNLQLIAKLKLKLTEQAVALIRTNQRHKVAPPRAAQR